METSSIILQVAVILVAARVLGEVAIFFRVPSVIGEMVAGLILGPTLLGFVEPGGMIQVLAEIGIILLLFQVGLETNVGELVDSGKNSIIVAIAGFVLPFCVCFALTRYLFELELLVSLMIAGTMTATSIGITMRTLADLDRTQSREGRIVLGAAVLDDIMGVLLLAVLFNFVTSGDVNLGGSLRILLFMAAFFMVAPMLAKSISYLIRIGEAASEIPGIVPTSVVSLVLSLAWLSHFIGIPQLLGGFATGLALSRRFFLPFGAALKADPGFSEQVDEQMKPIIHHFHADIFRDRRPVAGSQRDRLGLAVFLVILDFTGRRRDPVEDSGCGCWSTRISRAASSSVCRWCRAAKSDWCSPNSADTAACSTWRFTLPW